MESEQSLSDLIHICLLLEFRQSSSIMDFQQRLVLGSRDAMKRVLPVNMTRAFANRLTPSELLERAMLPLMEALGSSPLLPSAWSFSPPFCRLVLVLQRLPDQPNSFRDGLLPLEEVRQRSDSAGPLRRDHRLLVVICCARRLATREIESATVVDKVPDCVITYTSRSRGPTLFMKLTPPRVCRRAELQLATVHEWLDSCFVDSGGEFAETPPQFWMAYMG